MTEETFRSKLWRNGINTLYHITKLENIPSILKNGLYSREYFKKKDDVIFKNASLLDVQSYRKNNFKKRTTENIHDYACLFFTPHTPMLRSLCFRKHLDHSIAILQFDPKLMDELDKVIFTDRSCTDKDFQFYNRSDDLDQLDWRYLREDYDYILDDLNSEEKTTFEKVRGAEILVFEQINPFYLKKEILVKSEEAERKLSDILSNASLRSRVRITKKEKTFPLRTGSNAYIRKMSAK
jgi:hypothetical protein